MRASVFLEIEGKAETVRLEFSEKPLYPVLCGLKFYRYGESDPKLRPSVVGQDI